MVPFHRNCHRLYESQMFLGYSQIFKDSQPIKKALNSMNEDFVGLFDPLKMCMKK